MKRLQKSVYSQVGSHNHEYATEKDVTYGNILSGMQCYRIPHELEAVLVPVARFSFEEITCSVRTVYADSGVSKAYFKAKNEVARQIP